MANHANGVDEHNDTNDIQVRSGDESSHTSAVESVRQASIQLSHLLRLFDVGRVTLTQKEATRIQRELQVINLQIAAAEVRVRERMEKGHPDMPDIPDGSGAP